MAVDAVHATPHHRLSDIWQLYTHWRILLFGGGVALALVEIKLGCITRWKLTFSPAWLLALPAALLLLPRSPFPNTGATLIFGSVFGAAVVVLCTLISLDRPGRFSRLAVLLGDASYSTYLFHLWIFTLTMPPMVRVYAHFHSLPQSPIAFLLVGLVGANVLGVAVHVFVERPITLALKRLTFDFGSRPRIVPTYLRDPIATG